MRSDGSHDACLLSTQSYQHGASLVVRRSYSYDALARLETRDTRYPNKGISYNDSFAYNHRSELTGALLDDSAYTYAYDNIGNLEGIFTITNLYIK